MAGIDMEQDSSRIGSEAFSADEDERSVASLSTLSTEGVHPCRVFSGKVPF